MKNRFFFAFGLSLTRKSFWKFITITITIKLPVKLMILLLMYQLYQLSKVPSIDIQKFLSRIRLKSVSLSMLNWCGGVVFKRGNIANIS
jgi:hypothetical protein